MSSQDLVAGAALIAFGIFLVAYGLGWANATPGAINSILKPKRQGVGRSCFTP